jgi:16S rRNA (cytidine1402-2'-O)-methyltransferase
MLEKAKQKKSIVKNFIRLENFRQKEQASGDSKEQGGEERKEDTDDFDLLYGIENEQTQEMKDKIKKSKQKKGRGLLLSFYEFNQEQRVPRLIRAIKMGFRIALVSDAGTPTISDPGYKFIN